MDPAGKVAVIIGSGLGVGRGIASVLARSGAAIVVNDISEAAGRATVSRIESDGGKAAFVRADITLQADVDRMIAFAEESFGGLDILINNAGAGDPPGFPVAPPERWNSVLDIYLRATMACTQTALPAFDRRGGGAVVNISSLAGVGYRPYWWPEYAAAKAAVIRFTARSALSPERGTCASIASAELGRHGEGQADSGGHVRGKAPRAVRPRRLALFRSPE